MKQDNEDAEKQREKRGSNFSNDYFRKNQNYYSKFYTNNPNSSNNRRFNDFQFNSPEERVNRFIKYFFYFSVAFLLYMILVANYRRKQVYHQMMAGEPSLYTTQNNPYVNNPYNQPNNQPYNQSYNQSYNQPYNQSFQPVNQRMRNDDPYIQTQQPQIRNQDYDPYIHGIRNRPR